MHLRQIISHISIFALLYSQIFFSFSSSAAFAQELPIQADGSTNTQVTQTASGVDQINIAAPNSSGISHNRFSDYNINNSGQIINNFSGQNPSEIAGGSGENAVTRTEIAGFVNVNQNLANSGSAAIILNEVTSTRNSQLRGYAEIAGSKAELIIANPNGITCSGCGFINTSRLSFIAGSSAFDANGNLNFNVRENISAGVPLITVSGLGLDASKVSSASIVASSIKLLSTIYGNETNAVSLISGDGNYKYKSGEFAQNQNSSANGAELFAIDATNLGAVQAGRIFIIANKDGVGVNLGGDILASREIEIDVAGNLFYKKIAANDNVDIRAKGDVANASSAAQIIARDVVVSSDGDIINYGSISGAKVDFDKANLIRNFGEIAANDLTLAAFGGLENGGLVYGGNSLAIDGGGIENLADGVIYSSLAFAVNLSRGFVNYGRVLSDNKLTISSAELKNYNEISALSLDLTGGDFYNENKIFAQNLVNINAADVENAEGGVISSRDEGVIIVGDDVENLGEISARKDLKIDATNIANSNKISALGDLDLTAKEDLSNSKLIWAGGLIDARGKNIYNEGADSIISSTGLDVKVNSSVLIKNSGEISAKNKLNIGFGDLENVGSLIANNLNFEGKNLVNENEILANQLLIKANLTNRGDITSNGALNIEAESLLNFNNIVAVNGDFVVDLGGVGILENKGLIQARNADLLIKNGEKINNENVIIGKNLLEIKGVKNLANSKEISAQNLNIELGGDFDNKGGESFIVAQNSSAIFAANVDNEGLISAKEQIIKADNIENKASGEISASEKLTINNKVDIDNFGKILSAKELIINSENVENWAVIFAKEKLSLNGGGLENKGVGEVGAQNIEVTLQKNFVNKSKIISSNNLKISADNFANDGVVAANFDLNILSKNDFENDGRVSSGNDLKLDSKTINNGENNSKAVIISGKNFELKALENVVNKGAIVAKEELGVISGEAISNYNLINAGNISEVESAKIENYSGAEISAYGAINIGKAKSVINEGKILSGGNLNIGGELDILENEGLSALVASTEGLATIDADESVKNSGTIFSKFALNIKSAGDVVNDNIINSQNDVVVIGAAGDVKNNTTIKAAGDVEISAKNLENGAGSLIFSKGDVGIIAVNGVENSGEISGQNQVKMASKVLTNQGGGLIIGKSGDFKIDENLTNYGNIFALEDLKIQANILQNNAGSYVGANQKLDIIITKNLINEGRVVGGAVQLSAAILNNKKDAIIFGQNLNNIEVELVENFGEISALDEVRITANDLENKALGLVTAAKTNLKTNNKILNSGEISAKNLLEILADGEGLTNDGKIIGQKDLTINLQNSALVNDGLIFANNSGLIESGALLNKGKGKISSAENLTINSVNSLANDGDIFAANDLNIAAKGAVNSGNIIAINGDAVVDLGGASLENKGVIQARSDDLLIKNGEKIDNSNIISAKDLLEIKAVKNLQNSKEISSQNLLNIELGGDFNNGSGSFVTAQNVSAIAAKVVDNEGLITSKQQTINADRVENKAAGEISSSENLTINAKEDLQNKGKILSNKILIINAAGAENEAVIYAKERLALNADNLLNQKSGLVAGGGAVEIEVVNIVENFGEISSKGNLTLDVGEIKNNEQALIISEDGNLRVGSDGKISNFGFLVASNLLTLEAAGDVVNQGAISSKNDKIIALSKEGDLKNYALISAKGDLEISAKLLQNNGKNSGLKANNIKLLARENLVNEGEISALKELVINAQNIENNGEDSLIFAQEKSQVNAVLNIKNAGEISSGGELAINSASLGNLENSKIIAKDLVQINLSGLLENFANIFSNKESKISAQNLKNSAGATIFAGGENNIYLRKI